MNGEINLTGLIGSIDGESLEGFLSKPILNGLEYEKGSVTPTTDGDTLTLNYVGTHNDLPIFGIIWDIDMNNTSTNDLTIFYILNIGGLTGQGLPSATSFKPFGINVSYRKHNDGSSSSTYQNSGRTYEEAGVSNIMSETQFKPKATANATFKANRTYKWLVIWGD